MIKKCKTVIFVFVIIGVLFWKNQIILIADEQKAKQNLEEFEAQIGMSIDELLEKIRTKENDTTRKIKKGNVIPDFELANLDNENEIISMQSLRGKYVLLHIWGTWCAPCVKEIPKLQSIYNRFNDKKFTIYSIARDAPETAKRFRNNVRYKMPWLHSIINNEVIYLLEITDYPSYILVSPAGEIIESNSIRIRTKLEEILEELLN